MIKNAPVVFGSILFFLCGGIVYLSTSTTATTVAVGAGSNPEVQPSPDTSQQPPQPEPDESNANSEGNNLQPVAEGDFLMMVMVDQEKMNGDQKAAFQRYLQSANLPKTRVGERCQYYKRPEVWCLLLDPEVAQKVYEQLRGQSAFSQFVEQKEVRRIRGEV